MYLNIFRFVILLSILYFGVDASYCDKLKEKYNPELKRYTHTRYISIDNEVKNVTIYWNNEKTRAASEILSVLLRYVLNYRNVQIHKEPLKLLQHNKLMLELSNPSQRFDFRILGSKADLHFNNQINYSIKQLHVYLPMEFRDLKQCANVAEWSFYKNVTALTRCGFFQNTSSGITHELVLYMNSKTTNIIVDELRRHINASDLKLKVNPIRIDDCSIIFDIFKNSKYSFLFIDDDIWSGYANISKVQLPKYRSTNNITLKLDNTVYTHLINTHLFVEYAPLIHQIAEYFRPSFESLNIILEKQSTNLKAMTETTIEEVACEWAFHNTEVKNWIPKDNDLYNIMVFLNARDHFLYENMLKLLAFLITTRNNHSNYSFRIGFFPMDDSNIRNEIGEIIKANGSCAIRNRQRLLGAVVGSVKNLWEVAKAVDDANLPVIIYDGAGVDMKSKKTVWHTSGTSLHFALALKKFIKDMNWTRIAVLSEWTPTANTLLNDFKNLGGIKLLEYSLQTNISQLYAEILLHKLKADNARIVFVNTNYEDALTILLAATELENKDDYIFIVRDWIPNKLTSNLTHISISFWCRNKKDIDKIDGWLYLRKEMKKAWRNTDWPIHATAVVDAVLTLVHGFESVFQKYPQTRNDIHSKLAIREFGRSLIKTPVKGTIQNLTFKDHTLEDTMVFVDEWNGEQRKLIAKWQVYSTARLITVNYEDRNYSNYADVYDGATEYFDYSINGDQPFWYDVLLGVMVTIPIVLLILLACVMIKPHRYHLVSS